MMVSQVFDRPAEMIVEHRSRGGLLSWLLGVNLIVSSVALITMVSMSWSLEEAATKLKAVQTEDARRAKTVEAMRQKELTDLADIAVEISRIKHQLKGIGEE
jgi:hypothetical protein